VRTDELKQEDEQRCSGKGNASCLSGRPEVDESAQAPIRAGEPDNLKRTAGARLTDPHMRGAPGAARAALYAATASRAVSSSNTDPARSDPARRSPPSPEDRGGCGWVDAATESVEGPTDMASAAAPLPPSQRCPDTSCVTVAEPVGTLSDLARVLNRCLVFVVHKWRRGAGSS
jgi:hypothetical protein